MTAALLVAGELLTTACTNDDIATDDNAAKTVTFTATLAPKGGASRDQSRACSSFGETQPALAEGKGGGEATRAITVNNKGTANETLTTAWKVGEEIAVYYQKSDDTYATAKARVQSVDPTSHEATIATVTNHHLVDPKDGTTVKFVYPASLMKSDGTIYWYKIYHNQIGYLTTPETGGGSGQGQSTVDLGSITTISNNFDLATATGTIAVTGTEASVSGKVKMENQVCICKFNISLTDADATVTHYDITIDFDGGETYQLNEIPKERLPELYVAMRPVSSVQATITAEGYQSSGSGISSSSPTILSIHSKVINSVTLVAGTFYRNVPVTLYKNYKTLTATTGEMTLLDGDMLTGTGGANTQLKITDGATVMLSGVTNTGITQDENIPGIKCLGDATIILMGTNSVRGREYAPGIFVPEGHTLTIMGSGTLNATGGNTSQTGTGSGIIGGAGIGGTKDVSCGNIVIAGGTVTATGTGWCAGIGSGDAWGANITCGAITISGGTVIATGGKWAAGIGSGNGHNNGSNIFVSACGAISITGGTIEATSGERGAGIGSGSYGRFASISIGSDITRVTATRSNNYWNVPIGKGFNDQGNGAVTFGSVTMHDGREDYRNPSDWIYWPETGGPFGGIQVSASDYGSENGRTWTLTPKN